MAIEAEALARFAARGPTRYEQLGTLRDLFGFAPLSRPDRAVLQVWLLPIALTTTSGANVAHALIRITPLKAVTPVDTEAALAPLYACVPSIRITDLLTEVDRWTGFTAAFSLAKAERYSCAHDP